MKTKSYAEKLQGCVVTDDEIRALNLMDDLEDISAGLYGYRVRRWHWRDFVRRKKQERRKLQRRTKPRKLPTS